MVKAVSLYCWKGDCSHIEGFPTFFLRHSHADGSIEFAPPPRFSLEPPRTADPRGNLPLSSAMNSVWGRFARPAYPAPHLAHPIALTLQSTS